MFFDFAVVVRCIWSLTQNHLDDSQAFPKLLWDRNTVVFPLRPTLGYDLSALQPVCVEVCISWWMLSWISNVKRINRELEGVTYFRHTFCKATYISSEGCKWELRHSTAQPQLFCCPKQEASQETLPGLQVEAGDLPQSGLSHAEVFISVIIGWGLCVSL